MHTIFVKAGRGISFNENESHIKRNGALNFKRVSGEYKVTQRERIWPSLSRRHGNRCQTRLSVSRARFSHISAKTSFTDAFYALLEQLCNSIKNLLWRHFNIEMNRARKRIPIRRLIKALAKGQIETSPRLSHRK